MTEIVDARDEPELSRARRHYLVERTDHNVWQRRCRLLASLWRHDHGWPAGTQGGRPLGTRLPLPVAQEEGWNFLTERAFGAVRRRLAQPQRHEMIDKDRIGRLERVEVSRAAAG